jgi:hypothetical protein
MWSRILGVEPGNSRRLRSLPRQVAMAMTVSKLGVVRPDSILEM